MNYYKNKYDQLLEDAVREFGVDSLSRREDIADRKHCIIEWWIGNKNKFHHYEYEHQIADLLSITKATIYHYKFKRAKSHKYQANTEKLTNFLRQNTQEILSL